MLISQVTKDLTDTGFDSRASGPKRTFFADFSSTGDSCSVYHVPFERGFECVGGGENVSGIHFNIRDKHTANQDAMKSPTSEVAINASVGFIYPPPSCDSRILIIFATQSDACSKANSPRF